MGRCELSNRGDGEGHGKPVALQSIGSQESEATWRLNNNKASSSIQFLTSWFFQQNILNVASSLFLKQSL